MTTLRMTTAAQHAPERSEAMPAAQRGELRPVVGVDSVDPDRRRSVRDELNAAEERRPTVLADDSRPADAREVAEAISRLGGDVARVLQPVDARALRLILDGRIDEKA